MYLEIGSSGDGSLSPSKKSKLNAVFYKNLSKNKYNLIMPVCKYLLKFCLMCLVSRHLFTIVCNLNSYRVTYINRIFFIQESLINFCCVQSKYATNASQLLSIMYCVFNLLGYIKAYRANLSIREIN